MFGIISQCEVSVKYSALRTRLNTYGAVSDSSPGRPGIPELRCPYGSFPCGPLWFNCPLDACSGVLDCVLRSGALLSIMLQQTNVIFRVQHLAQGLSYRGSIVDDAVW